MNKTILILFALGVVILGVSAAPRGKSANCVTAGCSNTGPVCVIDDSGVPRTFINRCLADLHGCRKQTFYVDVKSGAC